MRIDKFIIFSEIEKIQAERERRISVNVGHLKWRKLKTRLASILPKAVFFSLVKLRRKFHKLSLNRTHESDELKKWSLDFLYYVFRTNARINISNYYPESDFPEIMKFTKNKIRIALNAYSRKSAFDTKDLEFQSRYKSLFSRIMNKRGYFQLGKYKLPINAFEPSIFFHKLGLGEIPKEKLDSLKDKVVIDAGAFIGDTALILSDLGPKKIFTVEPIKENYLLIKKTIQINGLNNVHMMNFGLGGKKGDLRISNTGGSSFISERGGDKVSINSIDNLFRSEKVGLIKMDIEGHELPALRGAKSVISRDKPILIICLYHRGQDFFEIPKYLRKIVPDYSFRFLNLGRDSPYGERVLLAYA